VGGITNRRERVRTPILGDGSEQQQCCGKVHGRLGWGPFNVGELEVGGYVLNARLRGNVDLGAAIPYSLSMADSWLEFVDGLETRRVPLAGMLTRIGGAAPDVEIKEVPAGEIHVWSDPPKVVMVAGDAPLLVNGGSAEGGLLADGDNVQWGDVRFRFLRVASAPLLEEIPVQAPAMTTAVAESDGGGPAWSRVRAGMMVELGAADAGAVSRWQEAVRRGDFAPDACARDLYAGTGVENDDPRLIERSSRLLKDFLMSSTMAGRGGVRRRARQAGKKGAAIFISQILFLIVNVLIIAVSALIVRARWPEVSFDAFFDSILNRG
jgi:hypothetical protein